MKYNKEKSYTGDELEQLIEEAKSFGAAGTLKRLEKEYVKKDDYDKVNNEFEGLKNTFKTEKFDNAFKSASTKYGIKEKKEDFIKTLAKVTIDDTPEQIEEKVKSLKVDLPELFNHKAIDINQDPNKGGKGNTNQSKENFEDMLNPRR